ncbi:MAG: AraC family transcriptional regulator [Pseudomonadota bacterium]
MSLDDAGSNSPPLRAFQHVQTRSVAVLEQAVRRIYPAVSFRMERNAGQLDAVACRCVLHDIALAYSRQGARLSISVPALNSHALLFAFKGRAQAMRGRAEVGIAGASALVASAGEPVVLNYGANFEHLILNVSPVALVSKLEALLGETLTDRLVFAPAADFRRPAAEHLRRQFMLMVDQLDSHETEFPPLALAESEQAVLVSFLIANDNNYSVQLHRRVPSAATWQVQRAEAYIEANWDQPMTIEALALVTGVSARTLFHSFRKRRGYSPMDLVKRIRLGHAWKMLRDAGEATTVTSVAFACGFGNLGHFSNYYRRAFGEPPSATLRRSHPGSVIEGAKAGKSIKVSSSPNLPAG